MKEKIPGYHQLVRPYHLMRAVWAGMKYGWPGRDLRVIGVTGTNGKTTTSMMIWRMLNKAGRKAGVMTTVGWGVEEIEQQVEHMTTMPVMELNRRMAEIRKKGAEFLVLEVTSHALAQFRILGVPIEIGVLTNVTQDHLDYHGTLENYRKTKAKLLKKADFGIINADDTGSRVVAKLLKKTDKYITYGIKSGEKRAVEVEIGDFGIKYAFDDIKIQSSLPGEFNVYNSLAAAVVGEKLGLSKREIGEGIKNLRQVPGRMQELKEGQNFRVIVDYAHTPDAFNQVFKALKVTKNKLITVTGGAGRRDASTREERGRIAAKYSRMLIVTEDDSRDEAPEEIAEEFVRGAEQEGLERGKTVLVELERGRAFDLALTQARAGEMILILGKGHEKTILRKEGAVEFEDVVEMKKRLKNKIGTKSAK